MAEGFHNILNSRFGMPHQSLRTFLDWLQKCQYETQCRIIQLTAGRSAKQKSAVYERLDADIQSAKLTYGLQIGTVFASVFPGSSAWPLFPEHGIRQKKNKRQKVKRQNSKGRKSNGRKIKTQKKQQAENSVGRKI